MGGEGFSALGAVLFLAGFFGMFFFTVPIRKVLSFGLFQVALLIYVLSFSGPVDPLLVALGRLAAGVGLGLLLILWALARRAEEEGP